MVHATIYQFKKKEIDVELAREKIKPVLHSLLYEGCQKVILGCTELSIILFEYPQTIDPLQIVINGLIQKYYVSDTPTSNDQQQQRRL